MVRSTLAATVTSFLGWTTINPSYRAETSLAQPEKPGKRMLYFASISVNGPVKYRDVPRSIGDLEAPDNRMPVGRRWGWLW
jgi:hypothetical protein